MTMIATCLVTAAALMWCAILLLPWRPWATRECLDTTAAPPDGALGDITVLIPARNESALVTDTLRALRLQGEGLKVILVDDQSTDGTAQIARAAMPHDLEVIPGAELPLGWSGKLWALEQGRHHVATPLTLLIDADIELQPGIVHALREKMRRDEIHFVSLMVAPAMRGFWEQLLMPAFVYFFKLLYPFRLSNCRYRSVAAAAGGCVLLETRVLDELGGFAALRDALIDDCALARRVKARGYRTWVGLTHSAHSTRSYSRLGDIWNMVSRSAFTQLRYSTGWLGLCSALMVLGFWVPLLGLLHPGTLMRCVAGAALAIMIGTYLPMLKFYGRSPAWALAMPAIGTLYLAMTWSSALRYWRGERARWKERRYGRDPASSITLKPEDPDADR